MWYYRRRDGKELKIKSDKEVVIANVKNNEVLDGYILEGRSLNEIYKFVRDNKEKLNFT